jgi:hypothetical protein
LARARNPIVRVLAGGISNRTVLVDRPEVGEAWVVKQALPKLRVVVDWFSDPERIHREALGLRWLEELAPSGTITPHVAWLTQETLARSFEVALENVRRLRAF